MDAAFHSSPTRSNNRFRDFEMSTDTLGESLSKARLGESFTTRPTGAALYYFTFIDEVTGSRSIITNSGVPTEVSLHYRSPGYDSHLTKWHRNAVSLYAAVIASGTQDTLF